MERTRYLQKKPLAEAIELFVGAPEVRPTRAERIETERALHRVTAEPIHALRSSPHYHGAAMDGIAVRSRDTFGASEATPVVLRRWNSAEEPGSEERPFVEVDTGSPLPPWADAVVMIEHVFSVDGEHVQVRAAATPWQHVRLAGEDIVATEPLLPRGHRIRPVDIGALLAGGCLEVSVRALPRVAILPTGSELVEPERVPSPGEIVEFNSRILAGFVREWGGVPDRLAPVPDDPQKLVEAIRSAAESHDVVLVIAGSSAGAKDYTVHAVRELGRVLVHGIEIMPGKPAICGFVGNVPVLGVPGYPVSAVVVCLQLLRPLLARLLGISCAPPLSLQAVLSRKLPSKLGLEEFVRVTLGRVGEKLLASPLPRGAGVITTMVRADGFVRIPALSEGVAAGETVRVELLREPDAIEHTIVFSGSHDPALAVLEDHLRRRNPELRFSVSNVGSLGGLHALARGEAHLVGTHLLDPTTGAYNVADIVRCVRDLPVVVRHFVVREQGLIVRPGNPKNIRGLEDLARDDVRFVNRQPGSGTRVLLDFHLRRLGIPAVSVRGYEREEFTHMAVAAAVASGLADCGLGVKSAAAALGLDFVPVDREEYDLVLREDFCREPLGRALLSALESPELRAELGRLPGYDPSRTGEAKSLPARAARPRRSLSAGKGRGGASGARSAKGRS
ncbi:MAG: molybdopterin biosynthesis protein [Candidatus Binatia bacterium]|nr:MAG: molybdopterin biosynthesis protein [Candidatus Binatia bacterium]